MLQGRSTEGLYGLANICEVLCYNGRFEDYKGLYGIGTSSLGK